MADRPSDKAIAQAFYERWGMTTDEQGCTCECCNIIRRARTLDAAPVNPPESDSKLIDAAPSEPVPSGDVRIDGLIRVGDQFPRLFVTTPDGVRKEIRRIEYMDVDANGKDKYPAWTSSLQPTQESRRDG